MAHLHVYENTESDLRQARSIPIGTLVEYLDGVFYVLNVGLWDLKDPEGVPLLSLASGDVSFVTPTHELRVLRPTEQVTLCNEE